MIKGQSGLKVKRLAGIALTWRMTESLQVIPLCEKGHTRQIIRLKCYKEITFFPPLSNIYFSNVPNIVLIMTILVLFLKTPLTDACLHTDAHTQSSLMNFPVESHTSYKSLASAPSLMISFICLKYWQSNHEILKRKKKIMSQQLCTLYSFSNRLKGGRVLLISFCLSEHSHLWNRTIFSRGGFGQCEEQQALCKKLKIRGNTKN